MRKILLSLALVFGMQAGAQTDTVMFLHKRLGLPKKPLTFLRLFEGKTTGNSTERSRKVRKIRGLLSYYDGDI